MDTGAELAVATGNVPLATFLSITSALATLVNDIVDCKDFDESKIAFTTAFIGALTKSKKVALLIGLFQLLNDINPVDFDQPSNVDYNNDYPGYDELGIPKYDPNYKLPYQK